VQTVLAVLPETGEVLGCAMREPADEHSCSGRRDAKEAPTTRATAKQMCGCACEARGRAFPPRQWSCMRQIVGQICSVLLQV
jgi:hypothetical protein